ncbi:MAG: hypothetical protein CGU29_08730 [Candidatus Dactylopiibacterium carminicum]|uniref:Uncharacterized protein n=1 Tax=Candidatus Dactylopiibacterium carminicum TaxID=857335 RepID=A0A272ESX9_9RHOO|nr:hypothetical protein [Candidatus Dactylopiibacterium carminicum]KAF7600732.1 hypothetical protein BGI27_01130 [Candidatus Dactylopiibacterium carminicum]PAS93199.1 MAG: hypothetical protein CGU29_08730 [Candidatus Dactylopiibacterium carminicum]PAT00739.1 MAG: hypothetical protein BSR46_01145 [Candidatus Dactylopiibacterium carminicum]
MARYRIVFGGNLREDVEPVTAKARIAKRFALSPENTGKLFSGCRVILKHDLDEATGQAYAARLTQLGMLVQLEHLEETPAAAVATSDGEAAMLNTMARIHSNLARAEAVLQGTARTEQDTQPNLATQGLAMPEEEHSPSVETQTPVQESVAAGSTEPPPAETPARLDETAPLARAAREALPEANAPARSLALAGSFVCPHCGSTHRLELGLQISTATTQHQHSA